MDLLLFVYIFLYLTVFLMGFFIGRSFSKGKIRELQELADRNYKLYEGLRNSPSPSLFSTTGTYYLGTSPISSSVLFGTSRQYDEH